MFLSAARPPAGDYATANRAAGTVTRIWACKRLSSKQTRSLSDSQWSKRAQMSLKGPEVINTRSSFRYLPLRAGRIRPSSPVKGLREKTSSSAARLGSVIFPEHLFYPASPANLRDVFPFAFGKKIIGEKGLGLFNFF